MFEVIAQDSAGQQGNIAGLLVPLLLMGVLFYFLLIRPQQRRARQQRELVNAIEVGDEVMTASGMFGTVVDIDDEDDIVTVEIAPTTHVRMVKRAISQRLVDDEEEYDDEDATGPHADA
jgi:preprotein translocase subunit YajC